MSSEKLRDSHTPCPRQSPQGSPGRLSISSPVTCCSTVVGGTQMPQHPSANGWFSAALKSQRPSCGSTGGCRMGMTAVRSQSGPNARDACCGRLASLNGAGCSMRTQFTMLHSGCNRRFLQELRTCLAAPVPCGPPLRTVWANAANADAGHHGAGGWTALVQLAGVVVSAEPSPTKCKAYFPFSALNVKLPSVHSLFKRRHRLRAAPGMPARLRAPDSGVFRPRC